MVGGTNQKYRIAQVKIFDFLVYVFKMSDFQWMYDEGKPFLSDLFFSGFKIEINIF